MKASRIIFSLFAALAVLSCKQEEESFINFTDKDIECSDAGGIFEINFESNVQCTYQKDADDWVTSVDLASMGGNAYKLTVSVAENEELNPRIGYIRINGNGLETINIRVAQEAGVLYGVSSETLEVDCSATSATFEILGNKSWTISSDKSAFVPSQTSGEGAATITVSFPENPDTKPCTATLNVNIGGKDFPVEIIQASNVLRGILASWEVKKLTDQSKSTFTVANTTTEGFHDAYAASSTGNAKIEYYSIAKDPAKWVNGTIYGVGGNGDPYVNGTIVGDYWLITANCDRVIPAGTVVKFDFTSYFGERVTPYWMLEYKDGDEFVPAFPVKKVTETAKRGLTTGQNTEINYSKEIEYNYQGRVKATVSSGVTTLASCYDRVTGTFTTTKEMTSIVMKFRPTGSVSLSGPKWMNTDGDSGNKSDSTPCLIDKISTTNSHTSRIFSAQHPNLDNGDEDKTYDSIMSIEFIAE